MKKKLRLNKAIFLPVNRPVVTESDARRVYKVVKSGWISSAGSDIALFEKNLSKFVNRKYACAVSSGTAALEIAVKSLGLNKNDEIIMPSFTIISNASHHLQLCRETGYHIFPLMASVFNWLFISYNGCLCFPL